MVDVNPLAHQLYLSEIERCALPWSGAPAAGWRPRALAFLLLVASLAAGAAIL